ncbi:hypothetical protein Syun_009790 [Stephania yunnanensis]|uniref:Uncharacterized protein n=1 Tax=Stephania yunnanensis TaxID=152371 RepID=A0AAP0PSM1_9MAGN
MGFSLPQGSFPNLLIFQLMGLISTSQVQLMPEISFFLFSRPYCHRRSFSKFI